MFDGTNYTHYKNIFLEKRNRLFNTYQIENTSVGIKRRNIHSIEQLTNNAKELVCIDDDIDCVLFLDWLKDEFTHLETPIIRSPHFMLQKQLYDNSLTKQNEYVIKLSKGILDNRYPLTYALRYYKKKFDEAVYNIEIERYTFPLLLEHNNIYYILDGKHTVALSKILNKPINARIVTDYFNSEVFIKLYGYLTQHRLIGYEKHLHFIHKLNNK